MCRTENIERINNQEYPYQAGIFYMDIICEAEKVGDFIVNVIDSVEDLMRRTNTEGGGIALDEELNPEKKNED